MTDEPAPPEQVQAVVRAAVAEVEADRTRLMDVVQAIQYRLGYIPKSAVLLVAEALGVHAVEVEDMVSFYAYLDREPKGRFHIRLSKTPVSLMNGAAEVAGRRSGDGCRAGRYFPGRRVHARMDCRYRYGRPGTSGAAKSRR